VSEDEAIKLAAEQARIEGVPVGRVLGTKYYSINDLVEQMIDWGPFWVIHFDDFRDPNTSIDPGLSVFVYEKDRTAKIPMSM